MQKGVRVPVRRKAIPGKRERLEARALSVAGRPVWLQGQARRSRVEPRPAGRAREVRTPGSRGKGSIFPASALLSKYHLVPISK